MDFHKEHTDILHINTIYCIMLFLLFMIFWYIQKYIYVKKTVYKYFDFLIL